MVEIKNNELKIGNMLHYEAFGIVTCLEIFCDGINTKTFSGINYGFLKPIILTREHLEKANFNFKELGFNDLSVSYGLTSQNIYFVVGNYYKKLDYLHQLQNIYYDFVGQELTFKD